MLKESERDREREIEQRKEIRNKYIEMKETDIESSAVNQARKNTEAEPFQELVTAQKKYVCITPKSNKSYDFTF